MFQLKDSIRALKNLPKPIPYPDPPLFKTKTHVDQSKTKILKDSLVFLTGILKPTEKINLKKKKEYLEAVYKELLDTVEKYRNDENIKEKDIQYRTLCRLKDGYRGIIKLNIKETERFIKSLDGFTYDIEPIDADLSKIIQFDMENISEKEIECLEKINKILL
ncbi:hypothetical protein TCON_2325 [Astathelohania contejeani]|uniref:Uncharacterized protein n=1 Tax=Astathelohania contejeani TaxID=164912 RepID=A0ABQ7HWC6_9MICR|nr:hypothetical protein TCON_2325 [Thelohania contejeani]